MRVPCLRSPNRPILGAGTDHDRRLTGRMGRERMGDDDRRKGGERGTPPGTAVITKTKPQTKRPNLYRVLILNDDYTPMEFVVHVLERFFNKDREAATRIMLHVHNHGIGECGDLYLRGGGDQGDAGHGLRPQTPASFAVRHGEEIAGSKVIGGCVQYK